MRLALEAVARLDRRDKRPEGFDSAHELRRRDLEALRQPEDGGHRRTHEAPFHQAEGGSVDAALQAQALLTDPSRLAEIP